MRECFSAMKAAEEIELERARECEVAGLPDDQNFAKIQRYETYLSRRLSKILEDLNRLQARRRGRLAPTDTGIGYEDDPILA